MTTLRVTVRPTAAYTLRVAQRTRRRTAVAAALAVAALGVAVYKRPLIRAAELALCLAGPKTDSAAT